MGAPVGLEKVLGEKSGGYKEHLRSSEAGNCPTQLPLKSEGAKGDSCDRQVWALVTLHLTEGPSHEHLGDAPGPVVGIRQTTKNKLPHSCDLSEPLLCSGPQFLCLPKWDLDACPAGWHKNGCKGVV